MITRISRKLHEEADEADARGNARASSTMREAAMEIEHMGEMLRVRARLVGLAALVVAALAMLAGLALALYGAQHVLQTMVV